MSNNYSFMILADGSIYCAAANLKSNKVSFDKDCLIGNHTIGSIKNGLIQEKTWVRICSVLVIGFSHANVMGMITSEYFPLITTLAYDSMDIAAKPILNHQYNNWDTGFYSSQTQSFQFRGSEWIISGWPNDFPSGYPSLSFSTDESNGGSELPFILKDDGIYVGLNDLDPINSVYMHIGLPDGDDVQDIGMIIQSEKNISVHSPDIWYINGHTISDYDNTTSPNWRCQAGPQGYIDPVSDGGLKVEFSI